jgi:hypothetical protein
MIPIYSEFYQASQPNPDTGSRMDGVEGRCDDKLLFN